MKLKNEKLLEAFAQDWKPLMRGIHSVRENGESKEIVADANIKIIPKAQGNGLDITILANTKHQTVFLPTFISQANIVDSVKNDYYIGANSDIEIIAGCGEYATENTTIRHSGIHAFHIGENAKVKYLEKHVGMGDSQAKKIFRPVTFATIEKGGYLEIQTTQIGGVSDSLKITKVDMGPDSELLLKENVLTEAKEVSKTKLEVNINGANAKVNLISHSVAKDNSFQDFYSTINGNYQCYGHSECDAILVGNGKVMATPALAANNPDANLIHEAAIGKIAKEQIIKLQTLGLTIQEAEQVIIKGFLK